MALPITFNNTTYAPGFLGTDDGGASGNFQVDTASTYSVTVSGTINAVGDPVTLTYGADAPAGFAGTSVQLTSTQFDNSGQILFVSRAIPPGETEAGNYRYLLSNTQVVGSNPPAGSTRTRFLADGNNTAGDYNVQAAPCFSVRTVTSQSGFSTSSGATSAASISRAELSFGGHLFPRDVRHERLLHVRDLLPSVLVLLPRAHDFGLQAVERHDLPHRGEQVLVRGRGVQVEERGEGEIGALRRGRERGAFHHPARQRLGHQAHAALVLGGALGGGVLVRHGGGACVEVGRDGPGMNPERARLWDWRSGGRRR